MTHRTHAPAASPATTASAPSLDAAAEFDRQVRTLVALGYPALSGRTPEQFAELVAPLRAEAVARVGADGDGDGDGDGDRDGREYDPAATGRVPFVLVVTRELAAIERTMPLTALHGGRLPGFVDRTFEPGSLERFVATEEARPPGGNGVHLLFDVERGEEFCGAVPNDAMAALAERGRSLLTIEEGIALMTHTPQLLVKNKCFSLGGSRSGDRRVPAIWISKRAPKLGWCWAGNPHTWLGMASAGSRGASRA
ncbi:DUF5701 family protein [Streptomyces sp. NPDC056568]|uniref:DUF5701 family protein n=1 Tax=Streptomyces sp. NPDC056568 TaxID=3345866 RepID=UPI0036A53A66